MRRYGFTGSRNLPTFAQATSLRFWLEGRSGELHHGDCIGGDEAAHEIARSLRGWLIEVHPGDTPSLRAFVTGYDVIHPEKPNLDRNTDIVNATHELVATPSGPEVARSGTWSTIRKARRAGKPRTIIWPDGSIEVEGTALSPNGEAVSAGKLEGERARDEPPLYISREEGNSSSTDSPK